jgi:hypothetical protein
MDLGPSFIFVRFLSSQPCQDPLGVKIRKWFINKQCQHLQNEPIFSHKNRITMLEQIQGGLKGKKSQEVAICYHFSPSPTRETNVRI